MPRAHLYRTITDNAGNLRPGGVVRVLYPKTTTEITEALYENDTDTITLPNPFTSVDGVIDFYMEQPFRVRIGIKFPNESERFFNDVDVMLPFDEGAPVHGHPYALINHTHEGDFSIVGHRHPANGIDLVPTGTVASTNLQDAVLELDQDIRSHRHDGTISAQAAAYTMVVTDHQVLASGAITITLPDAATAHKGRRYSVKNIGAGIVTIASAGGTIDTGATTQISVQFESLDFISDGTNWWVF